uniref:Uncharacterized protein n=1 Tax=Trichobilharzia regenti TaxID=157069 RepID=A0AA85JCV2_TRIRE|nr:unnamed protein product [Trichobilharzia regenti]
MIPRQFLQSLKSPFFGSFTRSPFFQSVGTSPSLQTFYNNGVSISAVVSGTAFSASGGIPSGPAASPAFRSLIAFKTSAFVGGLLSTYSCVRGIVGISGRVAGGGRFRSPLK